MSQVFAADSVNNISAPNVPTTTETPVVTGNFLNPPFGNAKANVSASLVLTVGTGHTSVQLRLRRNPNGENAVVANSGSVTAVAGNTMQLAIQAADAIPDGRPVQYQLTIQQAGGAGNGTASFGNIATLLISG